MNLRRLSQRIYSPPPLPLGTLPLAQGLRPCGRKRLGQAEAGCGQAYVAGSRGVSTGNMPMIGWSGRGDFILDRGGRLTVDNVNVSPKAL